MKIVIRKIDIFVKVDILEVNLGPIWPVLTLPSSFSKVRWFYVWPTVRWFMFDRKMHLSDDNLWFQFTFILIKECHFA